MPVKLRVTNAESESSSPSEYVFEKDRVTIGRGSENDLTLSDPRRIVSAEHAEVRKAGSTYQLIDRGSKNFTYLRGERLRAGEPHDLDSGDVFRVGNFEIEFRLEERQSSSPAEDRTVFAAEFSNPFSEPVEELVEAVNKLAQAYEEELPQRREDALEEAIRGTDLELKDQDAIHRALELLGLSFPESTDSSSGDTLSSPEESSSEETLGNSAVDEPDSEPSATEPPSPPSRPEVSVQANSGAFNSVLDTLVESLLRIVGIPWRFRHEFIGQTIMQSSETRFLYDGDVSTIKSHLLDPSLSQEEREKRLSYVEDAAEALAVHQVAMLNGYKASVTQGTAELLEQLDPDVHEAEVTEEHPIYRYAPALASPVVLERLRREWRDLNRNDWSAAEQRVFRPAFIKAYLARMTAVDASDEGISGQSAP